MIGENRMTAVKTLLGIFLAAASALAPIASALAISGDGLIAYPANPDPNNPLSESWFIYNLNPGESKEDSLVLKNDSDQKQSMKIYAVDSTANNVGEFALKGEEEEKKGVGKWISLETGSISLEPREKKEIKFTIAVPQDAAPGETSGGIIIQKEMTEEQKNAKSGFVITTRIGIRVYETVPGEVLEKASFGNAWVEYDKDSGGYVLNINIKNEGNISIEPEIKVEVKDALFGRQNDSLTQKAMIPRGAEARISFPLPKSKIGKFEIFPVLSYGKDKPQTVAYPQKLGFLAIPRGALEIAGLLLLVNILFAAFLKLSSRKEKKFYRTYMVQKEDNLELLAHKFGVKWKRIAKINKLKPPYQLAEGQRLTVIDRQGVVESMAAERFRQSEEAAGTDEEACERKWDGWTEEDAPRKNPEKINRKILSAAAFAVLIIACVFCLNMARKENSTPADNSSKIAGQNGNNEQNNGQQKEGGEEKADKGNGQENGKTDMTGETEAATPSSSSPLTSADRGGVKIEIRNGSGIKGASAKASALFAAKGYANVSSGNADNFNYTGIILECAANVDARICEEAKTLLLEAYPNAAIIQKGGAENGTVKIIIGK